MFVVDSPTHPFALTGLQRDWSVGVFWGMKKIMIALKMDPRMKKALQKVADKQLLTMSTLVRQLVDKHLTEHCAEWREEKSEK